MEPSVITLVISALSGGLAGGFLTSRINNRRYKTELSVTFIKEAERTIEEIEDVYSILKYHMNSEGRINQSSSKKENFDKVVNVGEYLDMIAYFILRSKLDKDLIGKTNILFIIKVFVFLLKNFKTSIYDYRATDPGNDYKPLDWKEAWPSLYEMKQGKKYSLYSISSWIFG